MEKLAGNHDQREIGPGVTLMCMAPEAQDLMLRAERGYEAHAKAMGARQSVPGLLQWLFKSSGLVDNLQEIATTEFEKHRAKIKEGLSGHPDPKFRRSVNRRSVHSFTYWFFRWSGLVDCHGKAVST